MRDNAVPVRMQTRHQSRKRRHRRDAGRKSTLELHAFFRQGINTRRGVFEVAVAAQMIGAQAVNGEDDEVHNGWPWVMGKK